MKIIRSVGVAVATGAVLALTAVAMPTSAQADTIVGIEYANSGYGGSSLNVTVPGNGFTCTGPTSDVDASLSSMPSGWSDRISSFHTYANCWARHYEHSNFGGASVGYSSSRSYIGDSMNDRTSSIRWS